MTTPCIAHPQAYPQIHYIYALNPIPWTSNSSHYQPTGDQPNAIKQLVEGINQNDKYQVLLGVTGSGKTFTMANVIAQTKRPTLILTHNKTLTAQLYAEFTGFSWKCGRIFCFLLRLLPTRSLHYPQRYLHWKRPFDQWRNRQIETPATSSLLSGRRDIIIVSSVSCIYSMGNPEDYKSGIIRLEKGQTMSRNSLLYKLNDSRLFPDRNRFQKGYLQGQGRYRRCQSALRWIWLSLYFLGMR